MEELDLLKKDWQAKPHAPNRLNTAQIKGMLHKKSSSIVKWILIISILEFVLPHLFYLIPSFSVANPDVDYFKELHIQNYYLGISIIWYVIVAYFIYLFYKNYKNIQLDSDIKTLMQNILKVRKIVKTYIIFSLVTAFLIWVITSIGIYIDLGDPNSVLLDQKSNLLENPNYRLIMIGIITLIGVVVIGFIASIYFLMYGILLRKLHKNYKELKQLEV